jgi:hypothetical protein
MTIDMVVEVVRVGCPCPSFYTQRGRDYNEGNQVGYNMISIRTLYLLIYFTYTLIDIIIYALGSTLWSTRIFWMVGRVVADPLLGPSDSMWGGTPHTNPRQQPPSAW